MADYPLPEVTSLTEPYWKALESGYLVFQRCSCGHAWLPAREECPSCLAANPQWERACGAGHVVSWVTYHSAYHPAFEGRLPYVVAVVELDEGPRLMTNIIGAVELLCIDLPVTLTIERECNFALARFKHLDSAG